MYIYILKWLINEYEKLWCFRIFTWALETEIETGKWDLMILEFFQAETEFFRSSSEFRSHQSHKLLLCVRNSSLLSPDHSYSDSNQILARLPNDDQGSSGHRRPRRPGSLKLSYPSLKSSRTSYFSSTAFVVGEKTFWIQSRNLRAEI